MLPSTTDAPLTTVDTSSPVSSSSPSTSPASAKPTTDTTSGGRRPGRAARAAAVRRTKNAAAAAASSDDKAMVGNVCDTAPASPGSPGSFLAAAASLGSPSCASGGYVSDVPAGEEVPSRDVPKTATLDAVSSEPPAHSLPPDAVGEARDACGPLDEVVVDAEDGGAGSTETDELSDSLRLEPDIELEPGVDLQAELGLAAVADYAGFESVAAANYEGDDGVPTVGSLEDIALTSVDSDVPLLVSATTSGVVAAKGRESAMSASVLDLGFEMIDKDEAAGAATAAAAAGGSGASGASGVTRGMGAKSGKTSRKSWAWAWGRN